MNAEYTSFKLGALAGRRILIVDDMDNERQLLATYLEGQGCLVYLGLNGQDALTKLPLARPDLVLMDVRMPICDGLTACRVMQNDPVTRRIPVIFLSGAGQPDERVEGLLAGAVDYITKPFNFEEVRLRLCMHLSLKGGPSLPAEAETRNLQASQLDDLLFQTTRLRLLQHLDTTPDLNELADAVGTNARRLNEAFRNCVGITVFEYLREERMKEARVLLSETASEVQEIGLAVGFSSGANFATAFRERFGLTPTRFRLTRTRCGGD